MSYHKAICVIATSAIDAIGPKDKGIDQWADMFLCSEIFHVFGAFCFLGGKSTLIQL